VPTLLLFVHGLGGNAIGTWGRFRELLESDYAMSGIDVGFLNLPSDIWPWPFRPKALRIQDLARALSTELDLRYPDHDVVIVSHSLGGLVAKRYVVDSLRTTGSSRVKKIVFFGTPAAGAGLASVASRLLPWNWPVWQLRRNSDFIDLLREDWVGHNCSNKVQVTYILGGQDAVVARDSARGFPGSSWEIIALKGHRDLVKPSNVNDLTYLAVKRAALGTLFSAVQRNPPHSSTTPSATHNHTRPAALFEMYRSQHEPYYVIRREDRVLQTNLSFSNVWIWGPSGCGKTAAMMRALVRNRVAFRLLSLAHYAGADLLGLFNGIRDELTNSRDTSARRPYILWPPLISETVRLLATAYLHDNVRYILLEELPLTTPVQFSEFLSRLSSIIILYASEYPDHSLTFAMSSVHDPRQGAGHSSRMTELLKVMRFSEWRSADLNMLIDLILRDLQLVMSDD
jgi:hypothetical protein